jgi:hypothetical protein
MIHQKNNKSIYDLQLIDNLLCTFKWQTNYTWDQIYNHDHATREAMERLYDAWDHLENFGVTMSLINYMEAKKNDHRSGT